MNGYEPDSSFLCLQQDPVLHGSEVTGYCVEKLEQETFHKVKDKSTDLLFVNVWDSIPDFLFLYRNRFIKELVHFVK